MIYYASLYPCHHNVFTVPFLVNSCILDHRFLEFLQPVTMFHHNYLCLVGIYNDKGIDAVVKDITSTPPRTEKYVGSIFYMTSCFRNKNQINAALECSLVTPSDKAMTGHQLIQKTGYSLDNSLTKHTKWSCSYEMIGM